MPDLLIRVQQHAVGHAPRLADQLPPRMPAAEAPWPTQRRLRCPHCRVATFSVATLAKRTRLDQLDQMTAVPLPTTATAPALPLHRPTSLALEPYAVQEQQWWPASGRHILASATADTAVVSQVGENHMMHECAEGRPEAAAAAWGCCEALLAAHVCCCQQLPAVQAFTPAIAAAAARQGHFLGIPGFLEGRIAWIKTNFCWMMYRRV